MHQARRLSQAHRRLPPWPSTQRRHLSLPRTLRDITARGELDTNVTVHGWIQSVRKQKLVAFAAITDGTTREGLQAVIPREEARVLRGGMSVALEGKLVQSQGPEQPVELQVERVTVLGDCDPAVYPIQKKALSAEYLRDNLHLRARTERHAALLRVRDGLTRRMHDWFGANDFCHINTPILTSSDCEGAGEVFRVQPDRKPGAGACPNAAAPPPPQAEFFRKPAYLTVSGQLHLEAIASSLSRVYTLSPTFRAEPSLTHRHLAEFWMLEAEMAFTRELGDVMDVVEESVKGALRRVVSAAGEDGTPTASDGGLLEDVLFLRSGLESPPLPSGLLPSSGRWPRMTYSEAIEVLAKQQASTPTFTFPTNWGDPLKAEHEKWLGGHYVGGPVFVTDYPAALKPFYMRRNEADGEGRETVACFDLLVPGVGELAGGSLREERIERLAHAMVAHGLSTEDYRWYLDLRSYGGGPHGGYGMGWERFVSWVTGIENVRDCVPFPRWAGNMML